MKVGAAVAVVLVEPGPGPGCPGPGPGPGPGCPGPGPGPGPGPWLGPPVEGVVPCSGPGGTAVSFQVSVMQLQSPVPHIISELRDFSMSL